MTQKIEQFKQEAVRLFNDEILDLWKTSDNVWRNACAMDTILDCFPVCDIDPSPNGDIAINALDRTRKANVLSFA